MPNNIRGKNGRTASTFIVNESGVKTAVILPMESYEELIEDLYDLAVIAERKDEPVISFEELRKRLKNDGII
ncbi:MAG: hypothetical protein DRH57_04390 [Candidatus Cloacimonadota bacterium]|nr:MAG: hypothetical protein DRH57_04390 [Candidatus Cloacimonadota bacterium]